MFALTAAKQQQRKKGEGMGLWCSHLHKGLKFSCSVALLKSVRLPRGSVCTDCCASISASPALVFTVSPCLYISNRSAKISLIPGSWLARCLCFQEKPKAFTCCCQRGGKVCSVQASPTQRECGRMFFRQQLHGPYADASSVQLILVFPSKSVLQGEVRRRGITWGWSPSSPPLWWGLHSL